MCGSDVRSCVMELQQAAADESGGTRSVVAHTYRVHSTGIGIRQLCCVYRLALRALPYCVTCVYAFVFLSCVALPCGVVVGSWLVRSHVSKSNERATYATKMTCRERTQAYATG